MYKIILGFSLSCFFIAYGAERSREQAIAELKQSAIAVCVGLMVCEWANVVKGLLLAILHNTNYRTNSKFRPLTGSLPASNPATLRFVGVIAGFVL